MRANKRHIILWALGAASLANLALGGLWSQPLLAACGVIGLGYVLLRAGSAFRQRRVKHADCSPAARKPAARRPRQPADPNDTDALVGQMLAQERYALLLRRQIADNLDDGQLQRAVEALEEGMALVPDGEVVLGAIDEALDDGELDEEEIAAYQGRVIRVQHFFLDRYPVTNAQFYEFVAGGGYEQMSLWDESIWPAVLDFVDATGQPGPRFWNHGCYPPGRDRHPVVGVSWYEAAAYARWVGKRLPTDAEWVKAGSWPVSPSAHARLQRRYPWGETMDRTRANLWGSGPGGIAPVDRFSGGVSVGGVYDLIGNVWEWTRGDFCAADSPQFDVPSGVPLKNIRGGAYDTYFDNQATCHFPSGEVPVTRKHNIGFRCAVGVCDLILVRTAGDVAASEELETASAEEVQI